MSTASPAVSRAAHAALRESDILHLSTDWGRASAVSDLIAVGCRGLRPWAQMGGAGWPERLGFERTGRYATRQGCAVWRR
jgi:hypothetical protein